MVTKFVLKWCEEHNHRPYSKSLDASERKFNIFIQCVKTKSHGMYDEEMSNVFSKFASYKSYTSNI